MAVAIPAPATRTDGEPQLPLSVAWVGPRPGWLELDEAKAELEDVEFLRLDAGEPRVVHVKRAALREVGKLRKALYRSAFVLDLTAEGDAELTRAEVRQAGAAEAVIAGSRWELGELYARVLPSTAKGSVVTRPLDLGWHAPEPRLAEAKGRGRDLRRFRRFHRLGGPTILFAGPYTETGGLDVLVETVFRLRGRMPDLRLAAIPHGRIDPRYRDRCEMRILGLGHHGLIEWDPVDAEVPFWYATAAVVCSPSSAEVSPEPAKRAAAAARPFVGSDVAPFREHVEEGATGHLVPVGDVDALEGRLEELLSKEDEAARMGEAARRKAEDEFSPAAAARALRREWCVLAAER